MCGYSTITWVCGRCREPGMSIDGDWMRVCVCICLNIVKKNNLYLLLAESVYRHRGAKTHPLNSSTAESTTEQQRNICAEVHI